MNWQRSGIDTITLQVSFYRKCLRCRCLALVMAVLISVPFWRFSLATRGAMAGSRLQSELSLLRSPTGRSESFSSNIGVNLLPAM